MDFNSKLDVVCIERFGKKFNQFLIDKPGFAGCALRFLVCRGKRSAAVPSRAREVSGVDTRYNSAN